MKITAHEIRLAVMLVEPRLADMPNTLAALPPDAYDCDACGALILPGAEACAHSAIDAGRTIGPWEGEFLTGIEVKL